MHDTAMIRSRYLFPIALIALIALTLVACDSSPATAPPEDVDEDVAAYLQALPGWGEFSPLESEQEPTPVGDPLDEEPVTLDVEKMNDDGESTRRDPRLASDDNFRTVAIPGQLLCGGGRRWERPSLLYGGDGLI